MKKSRKQRHTAVSGNTNIAVALSYDENNAPKVTAKGENQMAERIMALAEENDVPLYPNAELATTLVQIPLGDEVPEQLYRAVAEVISFAYILAGKMPEGFDPQAREEKS
jgi:flagellar biosynthesis protein